MHALLELTAAADGGDRGRGGGRGALLLPAQAAKDAPEPVRRYLQYALPQSASPVK